MNNWNVKEENGELFFILSRKKNMLTDTCPFCGEKHKHSERDGHRLKHCKIINTVDVVDKKTGDIFTISNKNGYFVRTI